MQPLARLIEDCLHVLHSKQDSGGAMFAAGNAASASGPSADDIEESRLQHQVLHISLSLSLHVPLSVSVSVCLRLIVFLIYLFHYFV